jgi:hypothetical protein
MLNLFSNLKSHFKGLIGNQFTLVPIFRVKLKDCSGVTPKNRNWRFYYIYLWGSMRLTLNMHKGTGRSSEVSDTGFPSLSSNGRAIGWLIWKLPRRTWPDGREDQRPCLRESNRHLLHFLLLQLLENKNIFGI